MGIMIGSRGMSEVDIPARDGAPSMGDDGRGSFVNFLVARQKKSIKSIQRFTWLWPRAAFPFTNHSAKTFVASNEETERLAIMCNGPIQTHCLIEWKCVCNDALNVG
jgi:hypothetical protein